MLFESFCIGVAVLFGILMILNRTLEFMEFGMFGHIMTFTLLTLLAAWIWTRPTPP